MRVFRSAGSSAFIIAAVLLSVPGQAMADPAKLDAALRHHMEAPASRSTHGGLPARPGEASPQRMVEATVHFSGDALEEMRARGVVIRSVLGDIATVMIPVHHVAQIATLPGIVRIEVARRPVRRLDRSVPASRADLLRTGANPANWVGATGKGVIVGVIDSGIDLAHLDFRNADGSTRVVEFWNQRADAAGTPPKGADGNPLYGAACSQAMINQALGGAANGCLVADTGGHGTHVSGISAGNGQATGNGRTNYRFAGVAPEADLMIANSIDGGVQQANAVLDAVAYLVARAKALGRPIVINLSLGSYFGPRDGTSAYERGLDNASGPGVIIVGAAGNEADAKIRAVGNIVPGQSVNIGFTVPSGSSSEQLELWYAGANQYDVSLRCGSFTTPVIKAGDSSYAQDTPCGKVSVTSTAPNPSNGDRQILLTLEKGATNLVAGVWTLTLAGAVVGADNRFSIISGETGDNINFTTHTEAVTAEILTDTVSARRVVAVAAYNTRAQWNNANGAYDASTAGGGTGTLGDISDFSSRGPRRMCSDATKCPAVMKPEITAPGSYIVSAYTSKPAKQEPASYVESDGVHVALFGTSMAAPHVTGAIALLMQAKPDLTPEEAKRILATTIQNNAYAVATTLPAYTGADLPPAPNHAWGYGIIDVAKAFRFLIGDVLPASGWHLAGNTLSAPIDVASVFGDKTSVQTVWKWNTTANGWEFYTPSLDASSLASYAVGKGYAVLSAIQPGEGYWVNLIAPATLPVRGGQAIALDASRLPAGWNLVATGTATTPAAVNSSLTAKQLNSLTTLWAWDNAASQWYFYAPALDAAGGSSLANYIASKGYLDFTTAGKKLGHGVGFWVNR